MTKRKLQSIVLEGLILRKGLILQEKRDRKLSPIEVKVMLAENRAATEVFENLQITSNAM